MMRWLDQITGRATMYRLVLICLLAILVEALLVSLLGQLPGQAPLPIIVSTAVVVAVSYLSNRVFALIFRVRPHSESSLITGLILALLFAPSLDPGALGTIALAGLLATASKYLLALRRRHVFNPAAAGAYLVSLIVPGAIAGWWVGTPWLLPVTVVAAFVILYRTRHLTLGIVFTVVATAGVTIVYAGGGESFWQAISAALGSSPIIFFAGIMLSEPLTLPPRRWQQLVLAVIVGVLFAHPYLGTFYGGYPLALLIGNLLAFLVGQRRGIRLDYLGRQRLDSSSWELSFRPRRRVAFAAGQFVELTLPHRKADVRGLRRTFSIASAPNSAEVVSFGLRTAEPSSSFKSTLLALEPGETVTATAVGGDFVLPRDPARRILLVAGGIGITPFVSHLAELEATGQKRDVVLVYATSSPDDLAYADRLDAGGHRVLLVAPEPPAVLPMNWSYLGAGPLTAELLLSAVPDARDRTAYVSGPPGLVHTLRPALRSAGVRRVKTDYFSGY
jgi:ferredoxin-NADP reductase